MDTGVLADIYRTPGGKASLDLFEDYERRMKQIRFDRWSWMASVPREETLEIMDRLSQAGYCKVVNGYAVWDIHVDPRKLAGLARKAVKAGQTGGSGPGETGAPFGGYREIYATLSALQARNLPAKNVQIVITNA
jgi:hypothetical protein